MKRIVQIVLFVLLATLLTAAVFTKPFVDPYRCVGCGDCLKYCPVDAIQIIDGKSVIDQEKCIDCRFCTKGCTYNAIREKK